MAGTPERERGAQTLERCRDLFLAVALGLALAVLWHAGLSALGYTWPRTSFLFYPEDRFNDWHNSVVIARNPDPYQAGPITILEEPKRTLIANYPPLSYVLLRPFSFISTAANSVSMMVLALTLVLVATRAMWRRAFPWDLARAPGADRSYWLAAGAVVLSYPFLFALDRGNLDLLVAPLCIGFVATLGTAAGLAGAVVLGVAIALKVYPAAFALLLLNRRNVTGLLACGLTAGALTVLSTNLMGTSPLEALRAWARTTSAYTDSHVLTLGSLFASSDPYNAIRTCVLIVSRRHNGLEPSPDELIALSRQLLSDYMVFSTALAGVLGGLIVLTQASLERKVWAACLICALFPAVTPDYRLMLLFPAVLFSALSPGRDPRLTQLLLGFAVALLIPKSYLYSVGLPLTMVMNPLLLLGLVILTVTGGPNGAWKTLIAPPCRWPRAR